MRFRAAGVLFAVEPDEALTEADRAALGRLDPDEAEPTQPPFRVELVDEPPWTSDDESLYPTWEPPVQRWADDRLLCSHSRFTAEIDPFAPRALLHRREERTHPLEVVVRTSMMARLPLVGGLPLHAAGVVVGGKALAFYGPSGVGKTTLSETCPGTVLSDELVAVMSGEPYRLLRSGFWGEGHGPRREEGGPLAVLISLDQGPYRLERLGRQEALKTIVAAVPVPLGAPLWSRALAVAIDAVTRIPVYRMSWERAEPPWRHLEAILGAEAPPTS